MEKGDKVKLYDQIGEIISIAVNKAGEEKYIVSLVDGQEIICEEWELKKINLVHSTKSEGSFIDALINAYGIENFNRRDGCCFPDDFYHYNGSPINNKKINEWIKIMKDKNGDNGFIKSGDTIVIKMKNKFFVAKNYWELDNTGGV